jgi:hypothetical protein
VKSTSSFYKKEKGGRALVAVCESMFRERETKLQSGCKNAIKVKSFGKIGCLVGLVYGIRVEAIKLYEWAVDKFKLFNLFAIEFLFIRGIKQNLNQGCGNFSI